MGKIAKKMRNLAKYTTSDVIRSHLLKLADEVDLLEGKPKVMRIKEASGEVIPAPEKDEE